MSATPASIKVLHPEFEGVADVRIQTFIDRALLFVNEEAWGERYDLGVTELACHFLAQAKTLEDGFDAAPGAPASDSAGGVSTSYAVGGYAQSDPELAATAYGRTFMGFRRLVFAARVF